MLYKEWLSNWLKNYAQPSAKRRTYTRYKEIVEQHTIAALIDKGLIVKVGNGNKTKYKIV